MNGIQTNENTSIVAQNSVIAPPAGQAVCSTSQNHASSNTYTFMETFRQSEATSNQRTPPGDHSDSLEVSVTPDSVIRPDGGDHMVTLAPQTIGQSCNLQLDNQRDSTPRTTPKAGHHPLNKLYRSQTDNILTAVVKEQSSTGTGKSRSPLSDWDTPEARPPNSKKSNIDKTDPTEHAPVHNLTCSTNMTSTQMVAASLSKSQQASGRPRFSQTGAVYFLFALNFEVLDLLSQCYGFEF